MITAERAESVNFSDVYYTANAVAVVRSENIETGAPPFFFDSIASSFEKNFITCLITVLSALFGTILAFLVCMFRRTGSRLANAISDIYVKLLQGTPVVVLLMILNYVVFGKYGVVACGIFNMEDMSSFGTLSAYFCFLRPLFWANLRVAENQVF